MPILPPSGTSPLDTVATIMNAAKVKLGQKSLGTLDAISGKLLDWTQPSSQQVVNSAWRRTQQELANVGFTQLKQEVVIQRIPIVATLDPAIPESLSWTGFDDGVTQTQAPSLPFDLAIPLKIWERPSGQNAPFPKDPMELQFDGLPSVNKQTWNGMWEWRAGAVYVPGALQLLDFRVLYVRNLGDFVDDDTTHWYEQVVPISDCLETFSTFICAGIMGTPENPNADGWLTAAENAAKLMTNREAGMKQRGNVRKQSRSGRLEGAFYW